ncbi:MAG: outer membrane protein assembly factor BamD [Mailhella sp.]|nr:outer membrane protein assembly factor BamD [Mailhella sp.]
MHKILSFLAALFLLSGCGGIIDRYFLPPADDTVQEKFEAGNDAMQEKKYKQAAKYFEEIKDNYPFSPYVIEAELSLADAHYLDENFNEAADAYKDFVDMHPRHDAVPYALFQAGKSLRLGYRSVDRSSEPLSEAAEIFTDLAERFPDTEYGKLAKEEYALCRENMAKRELFIADVYRSTRNYEAAFNHYRYVLETFPDVEAVREYTQKYADKTFLYYREGASEKEREAREGTWKNLFRWL